MRDKPQRWLVEWCRTLGIGLVLGILLGQVPSAVAAQEQSPPAAAQDAGVLPSRIRFNFKGAPFDQVLDFFSRATGLPVVRETDVPEGTLDYLSLESYEPQEALRILNIILQSKGVMLRVEEGMLYLQKLTEMQRENIPTYVGAVPETVTSEQIVTVVRPLSIALAKPLAERLSQMVAAYGSVAALEQQNALVITETAAQIRRLLQIIDELDSEDPDAVIEIFKLQHCRAADLMQPLNALLGQRVERYVVSEKGQQVKIEDEQLPGLSITFDDRTNSIIAKGTRSRIENLREALDLLDVPATAGGRSVRSVLLSAVTPAEAVARLTEVFTRLPEDARPSVLPGENPPKVIIVGNETAIAEGVAVLEDLDGGAARAASHPIG